MARFASATARFRGASPKRQRARGALALCSLLFALVLMLAPWGGHAMAGSAQRPDDDNGVPATTATATAMSSTSATIQKAAPEPAAPQSAIAETLPKNETSWRPPLCIDDAIALISRSKVLLSAPPDSLTGQRRKEAQRMMGSAREYCEFLDNRHSSLGSYQWFWLTTQKASAGLMVKDKADLPDWVRQVSAIAFEAVDDDIWVRSFSIAHSRGKITTVKVDRAILKGMPWTVICYLPKPLTLREITTERKSLGKRAQLVLYAGVAQGPEYGRNAITQMQQAGVAVEEGRDADAIQAFGLARENMEQFKAEFLAKRLSDEGDR